MPGVPRYFELIAGNTNAPQDQYAIILSQAEYDAVMGENAFRSLAEMDTEEDKGVADTTPRMGAYNA